MELQNSRDLIFDVHHMKVIASCSISLKHNTSIVNQKLHGQAELTLEEKNPASPRASGILPLNLFFDSFSTTARENIPGSLGIGPDRLLPSSTRVSSDGAEVNAPGNSP